MNLPETFARAANGDIGAQAEILEHLVMTVFQPGGLPAEMLGVIEIWARMLVTHGRAEDKVKLAGFLMFRASMCQLGGCEDAAPPMITEAMHHLGEASAQGHPLADVQRAELSRRLAMNITIPAEVMLGDLAPTVQ